MKRSTIPGTLYSDIQLTYVHSIKRLRDYVLMFNPMVKRFQICSQVDKWVVILNFKKISITKNYSTLMVFEDTITKKLTKLRDDSGFVLRTFQKF